jgi:hypothetical protein
MWPPTLTLVGWIASQFSTPVLSSQYRGILALSVLDYCD